MPEMFVDLLTSCILNMLLLLSCPLEFESLGLRSELVHLSPPQVWSSEVQKDWKTGLWICKWNLSPFWSIALLLYSTVNLRLLIQQTFFFLFFYNKIKHVKLLWPSFTLIEYCPVIYVLIQIKGSCCKAHSSELSAKYVKSFYKRRKKTWAMNKTKPSLYKDPNKYSNDIINKDK